MTVPMPGFGGDSTAGTGTNQGSSSGAGFGANSERVALKSATETLSDKPWSNSGGPSMVAVLLGNFTESNRDKAVEAYLANLTGTSTEKVIMVMADADQALAEARHVAEAGRQAVLSITPVENDITILEDAISDVRECRIMYMRALDDLDRRGGDVSRKDIRSIRDAFNQTSEDIGRMADIVAARVRKGDGQARLTLRRGPKQRSTQYDPSLGGQ